MIAVFVSAMSYGGRGNGLIPALTSAAMAHFVRYGLTLAIVVSLVSVLDDLQSISGAIGMANHADHDDAAPDWPWVSAALDLQCVGELHDAANDV
jgi:hypothetical protein